ncbi:MAG: hypothetical protein BWY09_01775 [Candidatus Hydrogenedentes bacterium ADurb.Bin179]|nr:MAG: hypothetical protein BWY09_01775 [Candidatus Hydrogenedentes bacterium ADurb.Bin179]
MEPAFQPRPLNVREPGYMAFLENAGQVIGSHADGFCMKVPRRHGRLECFNVFAHGNMRPFARGRLTCGNNARALLFFQGEPVREFRLSQVFTLAAGRALNRSPVRGPIPCNPKLIFPFNPGSVAPPALVGPLRNRARFGFGECYVNGARGEFPFLCPSE